MAQNIDEVYSDLVRDERFKSLYPTQSDFVQYLENEPSADTDIEELFGVKSASEYLKKKDQSIIQNLGEENSSSQSPLVGQTEPVSQETQAMVEQPQQGGDQNLGGVEDPYGLQALGLPPLGYGKSAEGGPQPTKKVDPNIANYVGSLDLLIKDARAKGTENALLNVLEKVGRFQNDPKYAQYVKEGQFKNQYNQLNAVIAEVYAKNPMAFSDKKFQEGLTKMGFVNPVTAKPQVLETARKKNIPTFFPEQPGAPFIQKPLEQRIKEANTPKPLDEKSKALVSYLTSYDEQQNAFAYDVQYMMGNNQDAGYEMSSEFKADYLTGQEQVFDKTFQADVNNMLGDAIYNLPANFFDNDAIIKNSVDVVDAKTGTVRTVSENQVNTNRKLTTDNGIYMLDDAGNPKVNPIYLDRYVERMLTLPGGIVSQQVVDAFNTKRKASGLDEYTKEDIVKIIKPRVLRLATISAQQNLENTIVEQRLAKINVFEDEVQKVNRDLDNDVKMLVGNSQKLINNYQIEIVEASKSEVDVLTTKLQKTNEQLYKEYTIAAQNTASPELKNAAYQTYLQRVSENSSMFEEQLSAIRKDSENAFKDYALQVENDAKAELEEIKKKYGVVADSNEEGKLTTAAYRKYRDTYKEQYNQYKAQEQANSNAMGWRLTDILQSGSARVFGNAIQALNAAVGYEDNPLTDLMKYMDFVQTKSEVAIKPFSQVLDDEGLFSVQALKTAVQSTVQQGPNLGMGIAATALSGNPYIGGSLMWGSETIDQAGQNYRDVFARTGSVLQAENAAAETLQTQILIAPVYTVSMLPFTKGFLSKLASGGNALGFAKKFGLGLALEAGEEIPVEIAQNYLSYKFGTDTPEKFATWLSKNGGNTALDVLPSIAVLGGGSAGMETYSERMTEQAKSRVLATLGRLGLSQTVADAIQVIGEGGVNILPEYLYRTQQIDIDELKDMKRAFAEVVKALPQAQELIRDQDSQKYYVTLASEKARRQRQIEETQDETQKKILGQVVANIEKKMADIATGKPQQLTKITFKDGGSVVVANDEMASFLNNKNFLSDVSDGSIQVTTQDANINRIVEEKKKQLEVETQEATDKGGKTLTAAQTNARQRGATIKDGEKINAVAQKARDNGQKNVDSILNQAAVLQSALNEIAPGTNIVFLNNDEYLQTMDEVNGKKSSAGNFTYKKNEDGSYSIEVQINLDKAVSTTAAHEVGHALLLRTLGMDPKLFDAMRAQLKNVIASNIDNRILADIDSLISNYSSVEQSEEFLVELGSTMVLNQKKLEIGTIEKIAKVISDYIARITNGKIQLFDKISTRVDFVNFMNGMVETLSTGQLAKPIQEKIANQKAPSKPKSESQIFGDVAVPKNVLNNLRASFRFRDPDSFLMPVLDAIAKGELTGISETIDDFIEQRVYAEGLTVNSLFDTILNFASDEFLEKNDITNFKTLKTFLTQNVGKSETMSNFFAQAFADYQQEQPQLRSKEQVILDAVENPLTTEDVEGREIEPGYEVFDQPIVVDSTKGVTNRKPLRSKAQIQRDFEINDNDFADVDAIEGKTMVGFLGDVQITGSVTTPTGLTLSGFGGPNYPAQANRNLKKDAEGYFVGRAAVWASTFEDSTGKLMKRMKDAQGALIGAQQNTGILGNRLMLRYFGEELKTASEKINSEETIVNFINEKIKTQFKKDKNTGVTSTFSEALGGVESFSSIEEFLDYLDPYFTSDQFVAKYPNSNNIVQKGDKKVTLLESQNTKKDRRIVPYELRGALFVKMFNIDSHKKFGLPSIVPGKGYTYDKTVLEYANDTMFNEAGYGDFVGFVEFDPSTLQLEKVDQSSDFYNPSYEWVITAESVRFKYFNEFLDGRALFYENASASKEANQTPFGLRPKAAAARAIMGSQPITTVEATKVKERQKGFGSKSQLTAPSSDKWSPSLTQAEVDNIVGGDFASTLDEKVKEGKKHSTQIATTVGTYIKWVTWLEKNVPDFKNAEVLDVGAGLGHIHKAFGNKAGVVESYEPFYDKVQYQKYAGIQKPNYSEMDASDVPVGKYDVVVNNAVLNVVPSDIRESILNTIGDALKPGGIAIINAMDQGYLNSLIKKIDAGQSKNIKLSNTEVFVRESGKNSYQKGWTPQELQSYVQDVLGNEFSVERAPSEITSMTTVLIKKNQMGSKSQLTDTVAESKKLGVPQRYKGDVGKFIGGDLYVHKSAMDILPKEAMKNAASKLPPDFNYEIIKYNEKSGSFSFIASPDWNTNPEPIVGDAYKVAPDGNVTITKQKADPQIYHHKWNFVRDNYNGFDVQESVQRSVDWFQSVRPNVNMFKIGTQSYWQNEALPNLRTSQQSFKSKSQLDFTQIRPEYDAVMNQQFGTKKAAYKALVEKGYTPKRIKEAIGLYDFDESAFKQAQSEIAVNAINAVAQTYNNRQDEIKDMINQNIGDMESIYADLIDQGYSNLEIFTAARDLDFLSPQDLVDIFGAEYRQTVKRAINASTPYPTDFLDELEDDARTLKVSQKAAEVADVVRETGLGLVDSAVAIDALLEYLKTNGFDQIAIALTEGVKQFAKDRGALEKAADWTDAVTSGAMGDKLYSPEAINYAFSVSSELFSQAGRILQLARYFNETNQLAMIERQLSASGVVLTQMQKQTLEALVNDYKAAQDDNKAKLKALEEDWSDQAWEAFNESEKAVGMATIRVAQFLEARKPIFWNERLTSGAARALLNVGTTILSFVANVENNIWSTNWAARTIQKFRDSLGSGIKGNTLSFSNWKMARKLTSKRMWFDMNNNAKFGVMDTSQGINRYYDNLAQVNFFRDVKWNYNFIKAMVKKVLNRDFESMTPEEQADAYDLTLVKLKNGDIELRDGKTYTFARSLAWTLGTGPFLAKSRNNLSLLMNTGGPLFAEATGRIMSYGGDIAFGYMAAQRAMIDYFQNIQGTRFQNGIFDSMLNEANGKMDEKTIRALSEILRADSELYARFEKEGLKRTLLGDNMLSGLISLGRGQLRKKIRTMYTDNRKVVGGSNLAQELRRELLTGRGLAKNTLQMIDVGLFTLMPFTKVPVNFLGSAIAKAVPYVAGSKYIFSEGLYQFKYKQFNEKYDNIPALNSDKQKRDYEKAKIELFAAKRQATYDAAQFVTSLAIYGIAMSAVKAGAVLTDGGGDPEKEKALKSYGLRGGLYNATLHWEYLKAGMPANFLARRRGFVKDGDVILNTNNAGFLGYAMGLYGSVYDANRKQEADNVMSLFDTEKSALSMLVTTSISSGIENLPMFQGFARIGELLNDLKSPDSTKNAWNNFASGTLSTSTAVFFPSFFSFMSKGNAEMVQSAGEINKRAENPNWPSVYGDVALRVVQKLNRNISFSEATRNEYYEAQIGPFGEDLSYKVTLAEPGTAGAYLQAFIDPFAIRMFSSPAKENQREIQAYRESAQLFGAMTNLALTFQQMTGRDFEWRPDGKTSSFFGIITNPMKNQFTYSTYAVNVGGLDEQNTYKLFDYNLPNDLYRQELKLRGEQFRKAMRKYIGEFEEITAQVQTAIEQDDLERAKRLITDAFEEYQSTLAETQKEYMLNYQTNREKQYLSTMNNRKLFTEKEKEIMKKNGIMNEQGLIP